MNTTGQDKMGLTLKILIGMGAGIAVGLLMQWLFAQMVM